MLKKIEVKESGDSTLMPGEIIDRLKFEEINEKLVSENKNAAVGERVLMGILFLVKFEEKLRHGDRLYNIK